MVAADIVEDRRDYYARRATVYERIYAKPERQADLRAIEAVLPAAFGGRRVLEVACGTGWWTVHGAREASRWLATDVNPQTMDVARHKVMPALLSVATVRPSAAKAAFPPAPCNARVSIQDAVSQMRAASRFIPGNCRPPIVTSREPSVLSATEVPCQAAPVAPLPTSLFPCCVHVPPLRVYTQAAPALLLSAYPPTIAVLPSALTATDPP